MRAALALSGVLALCLGGVAPARAQAAKRTLAVYPLQPLGTDPEVVELLEDIVHAEVRGLGNVILVPLTEVASAAARDKEAGRDCRGDTACLSAFGRSLGADLLFYCTVATLGGAYVLDAKLIDNVKGAVLNRNSVTLNGEQALLIKGVRELAVQLVAPEQYVGTLDLRVVQSGAEVFLDEVAEGTTPLSPLTQVVPGKHVLRVVRADHPDFERFVDVAYGRTTVLTVDLDRGEVSASSAPSAQGGGEAQVAGAPGEAPAFIFPVGVGALALGGVALVAGAVCAGQLLVPWLGATQLTRETASGETVATDRESYRTESAHYAEAQGLWWLGVGLGTMGVALVGAGAGALLWDALAGGGEAVGE